MGALPPQVPMLLMYTTSSGDTRADGSGSANAHYEQQPIHQQQRKLLRLHRRLPASLLDDPAASGDGSTLPSDTTAIPDAQISTLSMSNT